MSVCGLYKMGEVTSVWSVQGVESRVCVVLTNNITAD